MRWLRSLLGFALLAGLVVGVPWALVALVGDPRTRLADVRLDSPLTADAIIGLIATVILVLWAAQVFCLLAELLREVRGREVALPTALAGPQMVARVVVGLLLAGVAVSAGASVTSRADASPSVAETAVPAAAVATSDAPEPTTSRVVDPNPEQTLRVRPDDSLWQLAEDHLGDGSRWTEIRDLNAGRVMTDGLRFSNELQPGWELRLPAGVTERSLTRVVEPGDTLSAIAAEEFGDADRYDEIVKASKGIEQPDGDHLQDANRIKPGWTVRLSADAAVVETKAPADLKSGRSSQKTPGAADADVRSEKGRRSSEAESEMPPVDDRRDVEQADHHEVRAAWLMPGLLGGGALLAGGLALLVRRQRRLQARHRVPGQVPASLSVAAVRVEKTLNSAGGEPVGVVELIDTATRRVAAALVVEGRSLPDLAAIELTDAAIALHFRGPADPPGGTAWRSAEDQEVWFVDRDADPSTMGPNDVGVAPWPLLVTLGQDRRSSDWLLNLEGLDIAVRGDAQARADVLRHVAAQFVTNPWAQDATLALVGIAEELAGCRPERLKAYDDVDQAAEVLMDDVSAVADRLRMSGVDNLATARASEADFDVWPAHALMTGSTENLSEDLRRLITSVRDFGTRHCSAVLIEDGQDQSSFQVEVDAEGQVLIPAVALKLAGCRLTSSEASATAALLTELQDLGGTEPPATGDRAVSLLDSEFGTTEERPGAGGYGAAPDLQDTSDEEATNQVVARPERVVANDPSVRPSGSAETDPGLDSDLHDWLDPDSTRPKLRVLGPVEAWAAGRPPAEKKAMHLEMFAYLATRPRGATRDEASEALGRSKTDIAKLVSGVRRWCGSDVDGAKYVPEAMKSSASRARGVGVYEMVDVITDVDLFRRLRRRADTADRRVDDLWSALRLVAGRPYSHLRPRGWAWLLESDRDDLAAEAVIVDVAHEVVRLELEAGDGASAEEAARIALSASPDSDISWLDLAEALRSLDRNEQAWSIEEALSEISVDGGLPDDLPGRTGEMLRQRRIS